MEIKFTAYNPFLKARKSDKSWDVVFETSKDQYDIVKEIPNLPEGLYEIVVRPIIKEY